MPIVIDYPATAAGEPRPMSAAFLGGRAGALRRELFGVRAEPIEVAELAAKTKRLVVNGRRMRIAWDIEHDVRDNQGKPVLGLCEVDADAPDTVMISISGARLIDRPELFRSTAVHELAHAIFDMPAALGRKSRKAVYASGAETPSVGGGPIDWTEWRANEFMGAFLVPVQQLARALAKQAGEMGIPLRWRSGPGGLPVPLLDLDVCTEAAGWVVDALAELFGVSPDFMAVRLKKGGFIARRAYANDRRR